MPRKRSLPTSEIAPEVTASSAGTGAAVVKKMETPVLEKKTRSRAAKTVKHSGREAKAATTAKAGKEVVETREVLAPMPASGPAVSASPEEFQQEIARLAYRFWEDRGRVPGDPVQDWLRAEEEVKSRLASRI